MRDPDEIRLEISRIHDRIHARSLVLKDELSGKTIADRVVTAFSQDPVGSLRDGAAAMKNHPASSATIAAGLAMMLFGTRAATSKPGMTNDKRRREPTMATTVKDKVTQTAKRVRSKAEQSADDVIAQADALADDVRDQTDQLGEQLKHKTVRATNAARRGLKSNGNRVVKFAKENPVAVGLLGLAAGAVTAAVISARSSEDSEVDQAEAQDRSTKKVRTTSRAVKKTGPASKPATRKPKAKLADMNGPVSPRQTRVKTPGRPVEAQQK